MGTLLTGLLSDTSASSSTKYWGNSQVDGSWRNRVDGEFFRVEYRQGGIWKQSGFFGKT